MCGAETATAEPSAMTSAEALGLANRGTVAFAHTCAAEPVALRLACPGLYNIWAHPCILFKINIKHVNNQDNILNFT
ncbi:hypothetical protein M5689_025006 [Euphorbia peplus]|nr:hypothetical protein M5689_025006 [Euphorbia peplus]